jgi:hypothetical protein
MVIGSLPRIQAADVLGNFGLRRFDAAFFGAAGKKAALHRRSPNGMVT